ncbi:hypothetical protein GCM10022419_050240 [Nonomuraea rosea]|uniref:Uncharacterized protein n=1 Tax=Nonomuraea rosea TaxID=638574 RepID=A0ABP6XB76_9ACTN
MAILVHAAHGRHGETYRGRKTPVGGPPYAAGAARVIYSASGRRAHFRPGRSGLSRCRQFVRRHRSRGGDRVRGMAFSRESPFGKERFPVRRGARRRPRIRAARTPQAGWRIHDKSGSSHTNLIDNSSSDD